MKLWCSPMVGSYRYKVYLATKKEMEIAGGLEGITHHSLCTILIANTGIHDRMVDTLIHEIGHAIAEQAGIMSLLDLLPTTITKEQTEAFEEALMRLWAPQITQFLTKNKWLKLPPIPEL